MCAVLMPIEPCEQAGKDAQAGADLASLKKAHREAEAAHTHLQGELKRLRGEHSNLQVCILRVPCFSSRVPMCGGHFYNYQTCRMP